VDVYHPVAVLFALDGSGLWNLFASGGVSAGQVGYSGCISAVIFGLLRLRWRSRIVVSMGKSPRVLITAFRIYGTAIDLDVAPPSTVTTVPALLDLAVASSSYWLPPYSVLGTLRLFRGPCSILAGAVDAGGST
jgi:hypothetical protein